MELAPELVPEAHEPSVGSTTRIRLVPSRLTYVA